MSKKPIVKKILRYPKSRTTLLSVGEIFPKDWEYIIVKIKGIKNDKMLVEFTRINGDIEEALINAKVPQEVRK